MRKGTAYYWKSVALGGEKSVAARKRVSRRRRTGSSKEESSLGVKKRPGFLVTERERSQSFIF